MAGIMEWEPIYQLRVLSEGMGEGTQGYCYSEGLNEREAREA